MDAEWVRRNGRMYGIMDLQNEGEEKDKVDATNRILRPVQALSCPIARHRIARIYKHAGWTA
jgi:hypothetical protein